MPSRTRVRFRLHAYSCDGLSAQTERCFGVLPAQHLDRHAHVHDHVLTGRGIRHEAKTDDRPVCEPSRTRAAVLPCFFEHHDLSKAHQPGTSSSTLSSTTPVAPGEYVIVHM